MLRGTDLDGPSRPGGLTPASLRSKPERCRCGTHLGAETPAYRLDLIPGPVEELVGDQLFCGPPCARAFILEALEVIDASSAPEVLLDLDRMRGEMRRVLLVLTIPPNPAGAA